MCPALTPSCYDFETNSSMLTAFSRFLPFLLKTVTLIKFKHVQFGQDFLGSTFEASITQHIPVLLPVFLSLIYLCLCFFLPPIPPLSGALCILAADHLSLEELHEARLSGLPAAEERRRQEEPPV